MTTTHDTPVDAAVTTFSTDVAGLDECIAPALVDLAAGDAFELRIAPVVKQIGEDRVRMLAYNGSIPGPTLRVRQGSEISVRVRNDADTEATVHWHGLCLDNNYDGVPYETQDPIAIGGEFNYRVRFPDAGLYWYHPHIREDYGLDMGLYGNLVVEPADPDYWPPVNREFVVTLDDVLLEDGHITPYNLDGPNFVAMGRFGNVMLTGGESNLELAARAGEVVRFYLTNTANTRLFNVAIPDARMKLVGGDSGRYERHTFVDNVLLSPSERAIIDVHFETAGTFTIAHNTPTQRYILGAITVTDEPIDESFLAQFEELRTCPDLTAQRVRIDAQRDRAPDKTLAFESSMPLLYGDPTATADTWTCPMHPDVISAQQGTCPQCGMKLVAAAPSAWTCPMHPDVISAQQGTCPQCGMKLVAAAPSAWTCPMHPDVISAQQGTCPQCGMKLIAAAPSAWTCPMHPDVISAEQGTCPQCGMKLIAAAPSAWTCPMHPDVISAQQGTCPQCGMKLVAAAPGAVAGAGHAESHAHDTADGLEWEDLMPDINRASNSGNMIWKLVDRDTGQANAEIDWAFTVGDQVKIRLVNDLHQDHPMHHPFHIHGAGRFLVLCRDGEAEPNLVWKDTVLVRANETVDILLDVTNPGRWMAHCHIAEHNQSGMMFSFSVTDAASVQATPVEQGDAR